MKNQTSQGTFVYDRKGKIKLVFSPLPRPTRIDLLQNSPYEFAQLVEQGFIDEDLCECAPMHLLDLEDLGVPVNIRIEHLSVGVLYRVWLDSDQWNRIIDAVENLK